MPTGSLPTPDECLEIVIACIKKLTGTPVEIKPGKKLEDVDIDDEDLINDLKKCVLNSSRKFVKEIGKIKGNPFMEEQKYNTQSKVSKVAECVETGIIAGFQPNNA